MYHGATYVHKQKKHIVLQSTVIEFLIYFLYFILITLVTKEYFSLDA